MQVVSLLQEYDNKDENNPTQAGQQAESEELLGLSTDRPSTASGSALPEHAAPAMAAPVPSQLISGVEPVELSPRGSYITGAQVKCTVLSTWGDSNYYGLAGLQLIDETGTPLRLAPSQIRASPSDLNEHGAGGDPRTVDKLLDSHNNTTDSWHMWLAPWQSCEGASHTITIDLGVQKRLAALRIWNYNKGPEDSHRGIQVRFPSFPFIPRLWTSTKPMRDDLPVSA